MADTAADPKATATATTPTVRPKLRYQDRPEIGETFTDSIRTCIFDGQNVRIEFTVGRFEDPGALGVIEGKQVPVSRLVLSAPALIELLNRLGQVTESMRKAGILKITPPPEATKANAKS
jgi:hypothetical protein